MKGFLYFIIFVCGFYALCPDPIPFVVDDIVAIVILILAAIGVSRLSSSKDSDSDENNEKDEDGSSYNETTIYNYNAPGKTISLECSHCGASLDLDLDNLIAKCPYCGHKILIDTTYLGQMYAEREKTKREIEKTNREKEKTEREIIKRQYELERQRMEIEAKERADKR